MLEDREKQAVILMVMLCCVSVTRVIVLSIEVSRICQSLLYFCCDEGGERCSRDPVSQVSTERYPDNDSGQIFV